MNKDGLTLYHHNSSVCAAKIRVALAEKALDFESRLLRLDGDQFHPEYLALNPNAVVPTLVHRGRAVIESNVILKYLEDTFPAPPLRPADPHSRADARKWMAQLDGDGGIHHAASVATYAIAYRQVLITKAGGTNRGALLAAIDASMNPKSRSWLQDVVLHGIESADFRKALVRFDSLFAELETRLGSASWLAGEAYSIADVAFTPYLIRLDLLGLESFWRTRPAVRDWYARLRGRESAAAVLDWYDPKNTELLTTQGRGAAARMRAMLAEIGGGSGGLGSDSRDTAVPSARHPSRHTTP